MDAAYPLAFPETERWNRDCDRRSALLIAADGSCLSLALSSAVYGNDSFHTEIRVRIACELAINKTKYLSPVSQQSARGPTLAAIAPPVRGLPYARLILCIQGGDNGMCTKLQRTRSLATSCCFQYTPTDCPVGLPVVWQWSLQEGDARTLLSQSISWNCQFPCVHTPDNKKGWHGHSCETTPLDCQPLCFPCLIPQ